MFASRKEISNFSEAWLLLQQLFDIDRLPEPKAKTFVFECDKLDEERLEKVRIGSTFD